MTKQITKHTRINLDNFDIKKISLSNHGNVKYQYSDLLHDGNRFEFNLDKKFMISQIKSDRYMVEPFV